MKFFILLTLFLYIDMRLSILFPKKYLNKFNLIKNISKSEEILKDYIKYKIIIIKDVFDKIIFNEELDDDINNLYWIMI